MEKENTANLELIIPEWKELTDKELKLFVRIITWLSSSYKKASKKMKMQIIYIAQSSSHLGQFADMLNELNRIKYNPEKDKDIRDILKLNDNAANILMKNIRRAVLALIRKEKQEIVTGDIDAIVKSTRGKLSESEGRDIAY